MAEYLPDLPPPFFERIYYQAQPTVLYIGIVSELTEVSITDYLDSYYPPNPHPIFHPLILYGIITWHNPQFCKLD